MTAEQKALARHALGLPNGARRSYRNRYVASNGTSAWKDWQELVGRGLAVAGHLGTERAIFHLTTAGARAALTLGERLCPEDFPGVTP